jgi:hypothetical protein
MNGIAPSEPARATQSLRFEVSFDELSFIADGDRDSVFTAWKEFLQHVAANRSTKPLASSSASLKATTQTPASTTSAQSDEEPLNLFLERTGRTDSNPQIGTAIVLWAKRCRGLEELEPNQVKEFWRNTKHKVPGNVPRELGTAVKEGWLSRAGAGRYRITGHGESFIGA